MKVLVTVASGEEVQLSNKTGKLPSVGKEYVLEAIVDKGSAAQNRTLHPLLDCLYLWMLEKNTFQFVDNEIIYDLRCCDKEELKTLFKIRYGKGADRWEYVDENYSIVKVDDKKKIPDYVVSDFNTGNRYRVKSSHAISWTDYDKEEKGKLIDILINIMKTIGVDSQKFYDILDGIKQ